MSVVNIETGEPIEALSRADAERLTTRIRLRLDTIADNYVAVMPLIREAIEREAWSVMGYNGVSAYVSECFGDALQHLGVEVRREVVRELTASGMSVRTISEVTGKSVGTTHADQVFNAEHLESTCANRTPELCKYCDGTPATCECDRELAEKGMSSRAIAPLVGVSDRQIRTDIQVGRTSHLTETPDPVAPSPAPGSGQAPASATEGEADNDAGPTPQGEDVASVDPDDADDIKEGAASPVGATTSEPGVTEPASPPPADPTPIVGRDGKTYTRKPKATPRRSPLTDSFWRTAYDLTKKAEALHRLIEDDRWPQNAEKVAATHRNDLLRINDLLQQVINSLPEIEATP